MSGLRVFWLQLPRLNRELGPLGREREVISEPNLSSQEFFDYSYPPSLSPFFLENILFPLCSREPGCCPLSRKFKRGYF